MNPNDYASANLVTKKGHVSINFKIPKSGGFYDRREARREDTTSGGVELS